MIFASFASEVLGWIVRWVETATVVDWVLIAGGITLIWLAWRKAAVEVRLGDVEVRAQEKGGLTPPQLALLREELSQAGLVPSGGVPAGTPKTQLVAAIAASPVPQANWIASLIDVIPSFPHPPSFVVSGELRDDCGRRRKGVTYQVLRSGVSLAVGTEVSSSESQAVRKAANAAYRQIVAAQPLIFPSWSRWPDEQSFAEFRRGTDYERAGKVDEAFECFKRAANLAPRNMLAQLAVANRLERLKAVSPQERNAHLIAALDIYFTIAELERSIYPARFRAMVVLSTLATRWTNNPRNLERLSDVWAGTGRVLDAASRKDVKRVLRLESRRQSLAARRRLRPLWTVFHEGRLRHRFELRGNERREARKALTTSRLTLKLRRQGHQDNRVTRWLRDGVYPSWVKRLTNRVWSDRNSWLSRAKRRWWRLRMRWRYSVLLRATVGWQAEYNAACFYSQLLEMPRSERLRDRGYLHLSRAVRNPDADLDEDFVRRDDPDLKPLREDALWPRMIDAIIGREAIVHYRRPQGESAEGWMLRVSGAGVRHDAVTPRGGDGQPPSRVTARTAEFRVPLGDPGEPVYFVAHHNGTTDVSVTHVFRPGRPEVLLVAGEARIYPLGPRLRKSGNGSARQRHQSRLST